MLFLSSRARLVPSRRCGRGGEFAPRPLVVARGAPRPAAFWAPWPGRLLRGARGCGEEGLGMAAAGTTDVGEVVRGCLPRSRGSPGRSTPSRAPRPRGRRRSSRLPDFLFLFFLDLEAFLFSCSWVFLPWRESIKGHLRGDLEKAKAQKRKRQKRGGERERERKKKVKMVSFSLFFFLCDFKTRREIQTDEERAEGNGLQGGCCGAGRINDSDNDLDQMRTPCCLPPPPLPPTPSAAVAASCCSCPLLTRILYFWTWVSSSLSFLSASPRSLLRT